MTAAATMAPALPVVAAATTAVLGLLAAFLVAQVIRNRVRSGVNAGDGGDAGLAQAIRAHANFAEQAPIGLLLLAFAEATGAWPQAIVALACVLVATRLASAWALSRSLGPTMARQAAAGITVLATVLLAALVLYRLAQ